METQELLYFATPNALKHVQEAAEPGDISDYKKLKKLFDEKKFEAKSFEDSQLDTLTFDWQNPVQDRNWWWQLQALPFLSWYRGSFQLQTEVERARYFFQCLDAINCWIGQAMRNEQSPLVWHDHAAAFRLRNLTNWVLFCHGAGLPVTADARAEPLADLIVEHLDWLQEHKNYSRHTNHGFDQAMIALIVSVMFRCDDFEVYRKCNRERLKDEITFAFTAEGVHRENSPGYQKTMLQRLKQLNALVPLGEGKLADLGVRYIESAEAFLKAMTLPNGFLPMIGDTRGGTRGLAYTQVNKIDFLDYSASGYVIVRGIVLEKAFHLIFKASHLSHYHRHDDDLSIHLYFDGKVLLGDGGLGSHNERDKKRVLLRSPKAHNVPYIVGENPIRKTNQLHGKPPSVSLSGALIVGETHCFGVPVRRAVDLSSLWEGKVHIRDEVGCGGWELATNFFSAESLHTSRGSLLVSLDDNYALKISPKKGASFRKNVAYISKSFGRFEETRSYSLQSEGDDTCVTEVQMELHHPKSVLHEVSYRGFGPVEITEVGVWYFDETYPANVAHHLMSLRWLEEVKSDSKKKRIIRSFIAYHESPESKKSKYYLGESADHTASIRLDTLLSVLVNSSVGRTLAGALRNEISKNIRSCLLDTYKRRNNHGLMVDKAVLRCIFRDMHLFNRHHAEVGFVLGRVRDQLDGIFDDEGFCKEHSVSYQEYNLGIVLDLLEVMRKAHGRGIDEELHILWERVEKIKEASRRALGHLLKDDETYMTVGDSFEKPKPGILAEAFGASSPKVALLPCSVETGLYVNQTLGVAAYRDKDLHLVMNASWHSYVHKQNDDLSLQLRYSGHDLILDGGYSDVVDRDRVDYKSEFLHSTIIPIGRRWLSASAVGGGYSLVESGEESDGEVAFSIDGVHNRAGGTVLRRRVSVVGRGAVMVVDFVPEGVDAIHRFLVPSDSANEYGDARAVVVRENVSMRIVAKRAPGAFRLSQIRRIHENSEQMVDALDYVCRGDVEFEISLSKLRCEIGTAKERFLEKIELGNSRYCISELRLSDGEDLIFLDDSRGRHVSQKGVLCASSAKMKRRKRLVFSSDNGATWSVVFSLPPRSDSTIVRGFISSRFFVIQTEFPAKTILLDFDGRILSRSLHSKFHWHGSQSIDESSDGTIMYSEYQTGVERLMPVLRVWRLDNSTLEWASVLSQVSGAYPAGDIRHFHTCVSDPLNSGSWYVSSGDNGRHNKLWFTDDDGATWQELTITLKNGLKFRVNDPCRAARFTALKFCDDGSILWPTDDDLGIGHAAMVKMNRVHDVAELEIQSLMSENLARTIIDNASKSIVITEAKSKVNSIDFFEVSPNGTVTARTEVRNRTNRSSSVTLSQASKKFVDGIAFFSALGSLGEKKGSLIKLSDDEGV